ncbi:hypothetical protein M569_07803, partial [Genlisea aurea]
SLPLAYDKERRKWILIRELPEGTYEYKYIVDGKWLCNSNEPMTAPNKDGHVNNYVKVADGDPNSRVSEIRRKLSCDDPILSSNERFLIRQFLEGGGGGSH